MARSRNIKPGLFKNEILGEADPMLSLLFIGLWCLADRDGRLENRPKRIKAETFPYREFDVTTGLAWLVDKAFITMYEVGDEQYIQVNNWAKHQSPHHKEVPSIIPQMGQKKKAAKNKASKSHAQPVDDSCMDDAQVNEIASSPLIPDSLNLIPDSTNTPGGVFAIAPPTTGKFSMHSGWQPTPDMVKLIIARGVHPPFVEDSIPEFILYWREHPTTKDFLGGWDSRFMKNCIRQWERARTDANQKRPAPIPENFYPDDKTLSDLKTAGVPIESMHGILAEFVGYWSESGAPHLAWNSKFREWALTKWLEQRPTTMAHATDRSWAEA